MSNRKITRSCLLVLIGLVLALSTVDAAFAKEKQAGEIKRVAIVIDDFGNDMKGTEEMFKLPIPITAAVMPFLPTSKRDAQLAHEKGCDVILHLPMEPLKGKKSWLGPGALTTDLSDDEIRRRVNAAIDDIPYVVGINNHMGSKVTADERVMNIVLDICKERGLFFLDSRTTSKSVIPVISKRIRLSFTKNDIFLDELYSYQHISRQIEKLKKHIRNQDTCIAIGHVGPPGKKTAHILAKAIPALESESVRFVKLSEMVEIRRATADPS